MKTRSSKNISGRKHITKKNYVIHRREKVPIINEPGYSGVYTYMAKKCFEQFDLGLDRWKRQLFIRFDLEPGASSETNEVMTRLLKRVRYQFGAIGLTEFGYLWCREQGKGEAEHYHLTIWVDGDKYRASNSLTPIIETSWENIGGVSKARRCRYHFVYDDETRLNALRWLSYLCKAKGKGMKETQTKDYGMSRLKPLP
ncbi:MAG: inovirus Gp2 family protein [Rheinheimera sp.]|nr:MAG: inovirus Gp2 family protein [Rheinheimera sp.]